MKIAACLAGFVTALALVTPSYAETPLAKAFGDAGSVDLAPIPAVDGQNGEWKLFIEQYYTVPRGYSFSPLFTVTGDPVKATQLKAELFYVPGSICAAGVYAIDVAHTATQGVLTRYLPNREGIVELPQGF